MLDEASIGARIASTRFPRLLYAHETGSTNDDAARLLGDGRSAGTVVLTEFQRRGRGRRGRSWVAPAGSALLFTAILPRAIHAAALWAVPYWCALAVADGVERAAGVALDLQWPNDLLLSGKKACGILGASRIVGEQAWVACGVGLNAVRPARNGDGDPGAAYLSDVAADVDRADVFVAIVAAFDARFDSLGLSAGVAHEWEKRAGLPGARYRILIDGDEAPFEGVALRLTPDGGLVVAVDGRERHVALADARALRD